MINEREDKIFKANLLFLLLGLVLFYFGTKAQRNNIYSGILITEYVIILIPNLLYLKLKGHSLKRTLRLNKISKKQILYIILITIFSYPVAVFLNNLMLAFLSLFGEFVPSVVPLPESKKLYLLSLFILAITPGICEEVMFRGTIMNAYEGLGKNRAIVFSAILFGLFHINLQNLIGPIFLGLIFGIVVYKTNSIYSSILGHILNNGIAMTIGYFAMKSQEGIDNIPAYELSYRTQLFIALIFTSVIALGAGYVLIKLIKKLPHSEEVTEVEVEYNNFSILDFIPILIGFILFMIVNIRYNFM